MISESAAGLANVGLDANHDALWLVVAFRVVFRGKQYDARQLSERPGAVDALQGVLSGCAFCQVRDAYRDAIYSFGEIEKRLQSAAGFRPFVTISVPRHDGDNRVN